MPSEGTEPPFSKRVRSGVRPGARRRHAGSEEQLDSRVENRRRVGRHGHGGCWSVGRTWVLGRYATHGTSQAGRESRGSSEIATSLASCGPGCGGNLKGQWSKGSSHSRACVCSHSCACQRG